jgi:mono/diheme cytochrome c family protein
MKRNNIIWGIAVAAAMTITVTSCGVKRESGTIYMPDMAYSRAYETYAQLDSSMFTSNAAEAGHKIYYSQRAVNGTMERGEIPPYTLPNDSLGYAMSANVVNPLGPMSKADSLEAARLYNINCGICHGAKGAANGPLATSGKIGGVANLTLDMYVKMADGTMYHSIYYGKNNMGSYASQLSRKQRWQMVQYIRSLQPKPAAPAVAGTAKVDTAATAKTK